MRRMRLAGLAAVAGLIACGDVDMPEQHLVTAPGDLLTAGGRLREPGWSPRQLQRWNPAQVADPARLRRWDFFSLQSDTTAANITLSDLGFLQFATVGVIDLATGAARTGGTLEMNTGRLELSAAVDGDASFTPAGAAAPGMTFTVTTSATEVTTAIAIDLPASILGEAVRGAITPGRTC